MLENARLGHVSLVWSPRNPTCIVLVSAQLRIEPGASPRPSETTRKPGQQLGRARWLGSGLACGSGGGNDASLVFILFSLLWLARFPVTVDRSLSHPIGPSSWLLLSPFFCRALIDADCRPSVSISRPLLSRPMVLRTSFFHQVTSNPSKKGSIRIILNF